MAASPAIKRHGEKPSGAEFSSSIRSSGFDIVRRGYGEPVVWAARNKLHEEDSPMALAATFCLVPDRLVGGKNRLVAAKPRARFGRRGAGFKRKTQSAQRDAKENHPTQSNQSI